MENRNNEAAKTNLQQMLLHPEKLPPLPETAQALILLRNNPNANLDELVTIIEKDPGLASFIMKYARMAIFGYGERITSVWHAISLALGFNSALNMATGVASAGCLKITNRGPLGRIRIWHHALKCAALCRELAKTMEQKQSVDSGLAYLCGLFHNFGYLLFGHLLPQQYTFLNDLCLYYPAKETRHLELQVFGITHDFAGAYLIEAWQLPGEIVTAVAEHHFPDYEGQHAHYVKLVAVANRLLQNEGISDACDHIETAALLECLQIPGPDAEAALQMIDSCLDDFDTLATDLAA
ncbi:HDOD domain-containing protein [Nitrosomonas aestuarii]|uniref:HDOD domain-containing protein n=1 Tax=Nitrosomonas aestuarii TaxID=52441 RepID=UPI000D318845|nr:HDOD domain-containing protein [Nitrosomonas aestuarii]PTN12084.1 HD-like signal output (HDOD) protein [Nitrosomonas aestuarii]